MVGAERREDGGLNLNCVFGLLGQSHLGHWEGNKTSEPGLVSVFAGATVQVAAFSLKRWIFLHRFIRDLILLSNIFKSSCLPGGYFLQFHFSSAAQRL